MENNTTRNEDRPRSVETEGNEALSAAAKNKTAWNEDQLRAIETEGNVIVSAAAGAGKTAVMTERLVSRIVRDPDTSVEDLLVLTFTRAAAAQMKQRIKKRLRQAAEEAENKADRERLRRETAAVGRASISTIHSFCANLVRRHGHLLSLPPAMRILDEAESAVILTDVREELLTDYGRQNDQSWQLLLFAFHGEDAAIGALDTLTAFLNARPDGEGWLRDKLNMYKDPAALQQWLQQTTLAAQKELQADAAALEETVEEHCFGDLFQKARMQLEGELAMIRGVLCSKNYGDYRSALKAVEWPRLNFPKGTPDSEKTPIQKPRNHLKDTVKDQLLHLFPRTEKEELALLQETGQVLFALAAVWSDLRERFLAKKQSLGVMDYNDLEQYTIRLLEEDRVAEEYRRRFKYIAVDEYQDSNEVQEQILTRIAGEDNLFCVGDVKQSIYRFRQAEPALFMHRLRSYEQGQGQRIDLKENFRSAPGILQPVNDVLSAIMRETTGGMDYDERARLVPHHTDKPGQTELHIITKKPADPLPGTEAADTPEPPEDEELQSGPAGAVLTAEDLAALENAEVEGRLAARRIRELMATETVRDKDHPDGRPLQYSDIAILLRSSTNMEAIAAVLAREGISCYAQAAGGYFGAIEIMLALNLLRVIDNRRQDIPLASVLLTCLFGGRLFTPEELARIRSEAVITAKDETGKTVIVGRPKSFAEAFMLRAESSDATGRRCAAVLEQLSAWREESRLVPADVFLGRVLDETGLYAAMGAAAGGKQRLANLDILIRRARAVEENGERGIHALLTFMDRAGKSRVSFGSAEVVSADVVRLLTIHRSKGLEYPVVFVMDLGHRFNSSDKRNHLVIHSRAGIGLRWVKDGIRYDTAPRRAIADRIWEEQLEEEMRVLYVAMTRAEQRLILIGSHRDGEKLWKMRPENPTDGEILGAASMLDWICMGVRPYDARAEHRVDVSLWHREALVAASAPPDASNAVRGYFREAECTSSAIPIDQTGAILLAKQLSWVYPYQSETARRAKVTVSELIEGQHDMTVEASASSSASSSAPPPAKSTSPQGNVNVLPAQAKLAARQLDRTFQKPAAFESTQVSQAKLAARQLDRTFQKPAAFESTQVSQAKLAARQLDRIDLEYSEAPRIDAPAFARSAAGETDRAPLTPAERGSAVHKVMAAMPLRPMSAGELSSFCGGLVRQGRMTPAEAEALPLEQMAAVTALPFFAEMAESPRTERELPFTHLLPAARLTPGAPEGDTVLLQGILDACYLKDGAWVLVDYKTDRPRSGVTAREMAERHRPQLQLYAEALERLSGIPVADRLVVLLSMGAAVKL